MKTGLGRSKWKLRLIIAGAGLLIAVTAGPFVYIHFIATKAPAPLALPSTVASSSTTSTAAGVDGTWNVSSGSTVGYRVNEVLFGQNNEAAGRTSSVTGSVVITGTSVTSGSFTADLTTVTSDESRRDRQFQGRIMDTAAFPTATFTLTKPIVLSSIPANGVTASTHATGDLTMHGTKRSVTFTVSGRRSGNTFQIQGTIPVVFADWNIPNPSFGPVSTEDHGVMEFLLTFARA